MQGVNRPIVFCDILVFPTSLLCRIDCSELENGIQCNFVQFYWILTGEQQEEKIQGCDVTSAHVENIIPFPAKARGYPKCKQTSVKLT